MDAKCIQECGESKSRFHSKALGMINNLVKFLEPQQLCAMNGQGHDSNGNASRVAQLQACLADKSELIAKRNQSAFLLRGIGTKEAITALASVLKGESVLLSHECAYLLGQLQDSFALPYLWDALQDTTLDPVVRHEAAEAMGAIGDEKSIPLLKKYSNSACIEVAETCQLALDGFKWKKTKNKKKALPVPSGQYLSIDPAPPSDEKLIEKLKDTLNNNKLTLFDRYRAMFALRNCGTEEAIKALASGFAAKGSCVFRHEIAYVLGQIQHPASIDCLKKLLKDTNEHSMVRHEAAEALGEIHGNDVEVFLKHYLNDQKKIVRESCDVALSISDYWNDFGKPGA